MPNPIATISMRSGAHIRIELRPDQAPNTVASFISLANAGLFDDYPISRIVPGYVVQIPDCQRIALFRLSQHAARRAGRHRDGRLSPGHRGRGILLPARLF